MTHESHKRFSVIVQRLQISRWAAWKRLLCLLVSVGMLMSLCGCGKSDSGDKGSSSQPTDYEIRKAIEEYIGNMPFPKGYEVLLGGLRGEEWWTVSCINGEVEVSVRARYPETIPYAAELYLPRAQEAAEAAGVPLAGFDVSSYRTNKDGIVEGSLARWETEDGITGVFVDMTQSDKEVVFEQSWTIEQLFEYYADWDDFVKKLITDAGGSYE